MDLRHSARCLNILRHTRIVSIHVGCKLPCQRINYDHDPQLARSLALTLSGSSYSDPLHSKSRHVIICDHTITQYVQAPLLLTLKNVDIESVTAQKCPSNPTPPHPTDVIHLRETQGPTHDYQISHWSSVPLA